MEELFVLIGIQDIKKEDKKVEERKEYNGSPPYPGQVHGFRLAR